MKKISGYDLNRIFDLAAGNYKELTIVNVDDQQKRAAAFLKAVTAFLQVDQVDFSDLEPKSAESVFEE